MMIRRLCRDFDVISLNARANRGDSFSLSHAQPLSTIRMGALAHHGVHHGVESTGLSVTATLTLARDLAALPGQALTCEA